MCVFLCRISPRARLTCGFPSLPLSLGGQGEEKGAKQSSQHHQLLYARYVDLCKLHRQSCRNCPRLSTGLVLDRGLEEHTLQRGTSPTACVSRVESLYSGSERVVRARDLPDRGLAAARGLSSEKASACCFFLSSPSSHSTPSAPQSKSEYHRPDILRQTRAWLTLSTLCARSAFRCW